MFLLLITEIRRDKHHSSCVQLLAFEYECARTLQAEPERQNNRSALTDFCDSALRSRFAATRSATSCSPFRSRSTNFRLAQLCFPLRSYALGRVANPRPVARIKTGRVAQISQTQLTRSVATGLGFATRPWSVLESLIIFHPHQITYSYAKLLLLHAVTYPMMTFGLMTSLLCSN